MAELLDESKQKQGLIADVNHRLESDMVPLHKAVRTGNLETVKVLLKFFAEVNACDCEGKSPLHYAVQTGNVKMVQLMINAKVVVNHADEFGNTAMHTACNLMNIQIIQELGKTGLCDLKITNDDGKTALEVLQAKAKQANKLQQVEPAVALLTKMEQRNGPGAAMLTNKISSDMQSTFGLDKFEIHEKLGKGSFGSVYLVVRKDDPLKTKYAMKVLEKDKVLAQNLIRYAKTERNVLCLAKH